MKTLCLIVLLFLTFLFASAISAESVIEKPSIEAVEKQRVAILPFEHQASEQLAPFVDAIPQMLTTEVGKSEKLTILAQTQISKILKNQQISLSETPVSKMDEKAIAELARKLNVDVIITGSFSESNEHQIEAQIYNARIGKLLSKHPVAGDQTQVIALINKLAEDLSKALVGSKLEQLPPKRMAILFFRNNISENYDAFVASIPIMVTTALVKLKGVSLIEQIEVQKHLKSFDLEKDGVMDSEKAAQLGEELSADALVMGSFSMSGGIYELTGMFVDAKTGKIVDERSAKGDEQSIMSLPIQLGEKLKVTWKERQLGDMLARGELEVQFQITYTPMTERPKHYHLCKLFVDGKYKEMSKPVKKLNRRIRLFSSQIQAGGHDIEIVHGYVGKDGTWLKPFYMQPRKWHVRIDLKSPTIIKYEFHVGWSKDEFKYNQQ